MTKESKASDHVKPCNIAQSEAHNRRDTEYIKSLNPKKLYIRTDLSHKNESYVSPEMKGVSLQQHYDAIKCMVKQKTGRAMQEKDVTLKNGKVRKGSTPIRESVVNIKESTTMEDLLRYVHAVEKRWGIHALQIHIHKDEGHYENPEDPATWEPNYHAHIIWDWMNHSSGKSWKLNGKDMSDMQTLVAETLNMERGISKDETGLEHLERNDYIIQKQMEKLKDVENAKQIAETQNLALGNQREQLEEEIEHARHRKEIAEKDAKRLDMYAKVAKAEQSELTVPSIDVHPAIKNANKLIQSELDIPIPTLGHKDWRTERKKAIKEILTEMQTELIKVAGLQKAEVTKLGKALYTNAMKEAAELVAENKLLNTENIYLQADNKFLRDKMSKIDENAIEKLRREKDSIISSLQTKLSSVTSRATTAESNLSDLRNRWNSIWSHPEMCNCWDEIVKREKAEREAKERNEREKAERYHAILERFITEGRQAQREFALSSRSGNFNNSEFCRVYYAIVAIAIRDNHSLKSKSGIEIITGKFLDGCNWSGMSAFRKECCMSWTNLLATRDTSFEQSYIDTFLSFVDYMSCSAESYVSLGGSNGCADQLTNWDGTKKRGLGAPEKKKGGISM